MWEYISWSSVLLKAFLLLRFWSCPRFVCENGFVHLLYSSRLLSMQAGTVLHAMAQQRIAIHAGRLAAVWTRSVSGITWAWCLR